MSALDWLKSAEWSMGNGQCPDCFGVPESWLGHPLHPTWATIGHKPECPRATAIRELGGEPLMLGSIDTAHYTCGCRSVGRNVTESCPMHGTPRASSH